MIVRRSDAIAMELDLNNSTTQQLNPHIKILCWILSSRFDGFGFFSNSNKRSGSTLHVMTGAFIC